jgi:hypothetical protein
MNKSYTLFIVFALLVLLLSQCTPEELEQKKFGGDGAVLSKIDLSGAAALVSLTNYNNLVQSEGHVYTTEELFKIDASGSYSKANFSISGNADGGFDKYTVNDISENHFLLSFYLRSESYFIDKTTGDALKSAYIKVEDMILTTSYSTRHPYAYYGAYNKTFYYRDVNNSWHQVENYLDEHAEASEITLGEIPRKLYFDKVGGMYFNSQYSLYNYQHGAASKQLAENYVGIWNDLNGSLNVVFEEGNMGTVLNGIVTDAGHLGTTVYSWSRFKSFNFKASNKSLALFTTKSGQSVLYDLVQKKNALLLSDDDFSIVGADAFGKFIYILHTKNQQREMMKINVEDYTFKTVVTTGIQQDNIEGVYSINETVTILDVCEPIGNGACSQLLKVLQETGEAKNIYSERRGGKVVRLRY